jgi:hypothetical protein
MFLCFIIWPSGNGTCISWPHSNNGIVVVLEHHLCMFSNFMPSSVMVMKEVDNNSAHFQKPHQTPVGLEWRVEVLMYRVWVKRSPVHHNHLTLHLIE